MYKKTNLNRPTKSDFTNKENSITSINYITKLLKNVITCPRNATSIGI